MSMQTWRVIERQLETAPDALKRVHCLKLVGAMEWAPGDWFLVRPTNPDKVVEDVLQALALTGKEVIQLRRVGEMTAIEALKRHLEITQLDPAVLNRLQRQHGIGAWPDRAAMAAYANRRSVLDLLCDWPQVRQLGRALLPLLSLLAPRFYSIASSPLVSPGEIHLLFAEVIYRACGRTYCGAATHMMAQLEADDTLEGQVQTNKHFHLPDKGDVPIVMIGAGVGLAPFMGFIAHRIAQGEGGENWLFFGEVLLTSIICVCGFKHADSIVVDVKEPVRFKMKINKNNLYTKVIRSTSTASATSILFITVRSAFLNIMGCFLTVSSPS
ncbi:MAG TPA: hypothetical protein EYP05_09150, partial [Piscirickettsiaceae bacterium]|nr:hypothetical protein [Piscirickettsiaceae bacterium]